MSGFGSSRFSGSSCVESSGIYGQLRDVSGRSGIGSSSVSDVGHVWTAASLADGAGELILGLGVHVSVWIVEQHTLVINFCTSMFLVARYGAASIDR